MTIRSRTASAADGSILPRSVARRNEVSSRSRADPSARSSTSRTTTSNPATATVSAIPDPINPPPRTATRSISMDPFSHPVTSGPRRPTTDNSFSASTSRTGTSSSAAGLACPTGSGAGPALARQTDALLALLDALDAKATFFILGMAARAHPGLVAKVVANGHEIGCHGDQHLPVGAPVGEASSPQIWRPRARRSSISPAARRHGYRAPAFSITRRSPLGLRGARRAGLLLRRQPARLAADPRPDRAAERRPASAHAHRRPRRCGSSPSPSRTRWARPSRSAGPPTGRCCRTARSCAASAARASSPACTCTRTSSTPTPLRVGLAPGAPIGQQIRARSRAAQRNSARRSATEHASSDRAANST